MDTPIQEVWSHPLHVHSYFHTFLHMHAQWSNLWMYNSIALNFFCQPWQGLFWVEPVLLGINTCFEESFVLFWLFLQFHPDFQQNCWLPHSLHSQEKHLPISLIRGISVKREWEWISTTCQFFDHLLYCLWRQNIWDHCLCFRPPTGHLLGNAGVIQCLESQLECTVSWTVT